MRNLSPGPHSFTAYGNRQVYHVAGRGPVMVAHSGGPGVEYSYLRSALLEEHFTMVYVEPLGTGDSGPVPDGGTYVDTYAAMLFALVVHLGVERVSLLGHSHGGVVAQRFAVLHPERVAGLVLYSSTPVTDAVFWAAAAEQAAAHPRRFPDVPEAAEAAAVMAGPAVDGDKSARLAAVLPIYFADFWGRRAEFEPLRDGIRAWDVPFASTEVDLRADLPLITARTVVVTGRHDFICGPVWARMLHAGIAGSRLVILEDSGHFGHLEEPERFVEALLPEFADEVRSAFRRGDSAEVLRLAGAEVRRARAVGEPAGEVEALYAMSRVALRNDDLGLAEEVAREALDVAVRSGVRALEERPRHVLAAVARLSGDLALARERYRDSIALNAGLGQPEQVTSESYNLGFVELHLGHLDRARELFAGVREQVFRGDMRAFVPYLGIAAAATASAEGDHPRAARMAGFADSAFAAAGQVPDPDDAVELSRVRAAAVAALGEDRYAFDYAGGAVLDPVAAFGINGEAALRVPGAV
ncbi:alpha/beta fold hydrolase [Actinoplanes sp. HUAS TT8]|uniref:alpha/beta fold hydrolase n=1 Tax=Actinoplanes sp. HUAS TT8 TaxID=3447453 RepID=UPI003F527D96